MGKRKHRGGNAYLQVIVMPNGDRYVPIVLKIQDKYEDGVPENLTLIPDKQSVEIVGGEEFMVVYALENMVRRKT